MPSFVCRTCGNETSYAIDDDLAIKIRKFSLREEKQPIMPFPMVMVNTMAFSQWLYNQTRGECEFCYSVIAKKRYPVNIQISPGRKAVTIFSSMGQSLGDRVMQQVIRDRYVADNPAEQVVFLDEMTGLEELRQYQPVKIFWANLFTGGQEWVVRDGYWFAVTNEASEFARQGHYARLWFDIESKAQSAERIVPSDWKRYVVVHLRNQVGVAGKDEKKNISPVYTFLIFKLLQSRYKAGMIDGVVIVGNDSLAGGFDVETIERFIDDSLPILDLRNRWQSAESRAHSAEGIVQSEKDRGLKEIAWICKNAVMTIGRDSGIIQLAGAAGCPKLVSWDFATEGWFPKVKPGVLSAWLNRESSVEKVLDAIKPGIG